LSGLCATPGAAQAPAPKRTVIRAPAPAPAPAQDPTSASYDDDRAENRARREAEAHALFSAGTSALADGRLEDALDAYKRAYRLSGRPEMLFNIALVHDKLHQDGEAADAFAAYLKLSPDPSRRADAETRLAALRQTGAQSPPTPNPSASSQAATGAPKATAPSRAKKKGKPETAQAAPASEPASAPAKAPPLATPPKPAAEKSDQPKREVIAAPSSHADIPESPLLKGF